MVVTRTYRPSDVRAVEILNQIKAQLGISGKIDTLEERRKAYYYLKGKGWNMSMLACNPDAYPGDPEKKALCMLFNEMRGYQIEESIRGNEAQLKKYGSAFRRTYERNRKILEVQKKAVENAYKQLEKKTGVKTVPRPQLKPDVIIKPLPLPSPRPVPEKISITSTTPRPQPKPATVHVPQAKREESGRNIGLLLGAVVAFLVLKKVLGW
ncbi:hypothetical protein CL1_0519 [Thermococcus cleftensis]|uniref:Uncharacterized protein n=1 Tax=Thermococcus cleftensis (strain DSM 27260 / KACC 17922 / CL1) TaxID=163003 RepID=I3ZSP3_THECF|nr:hypothetical protein [Thermococcus cleftensis]AFL94727.1 hypothetical protein CL1_0519 [Thermococcus cleftensis]